MKTEPYKLSFTGVSFALSESFKIAEVYLKLKDWDTVRQKVMEENLIQARTQSSIQRTYQELAPRLEQLTDEQLMVLINGDLQEQKQILWYAVCKRYTYIHEFAVEVLHEKYMHLDYQLTGFDYDAFFNRKADWHEELDRLKDSTRVKIKTVLFRMLREAGLISEDHIIIATILSRNFVNLLSKDGASIIRIFPIHESDIRF